MSVEQSLELDVLKEQMQRYCSFSLGKKLLVETKPSYQLLQIKRDCNRMKEALECIIHYGPMPFVGIKDLSVMLQNAIKQRVLTIQDLYDEIRFIRGIKQIHQYEKTIEIEHPNLWELIDSLTIHDKTETYLSACINEYGEIIDTASVELYEIRKALQQVERDIEVTTARFLTKHGDSVVDGITTYRNGRTVVLLKASDKNMFGGFVYGDSASGQASYVEPETLVPFNHRKQELLVKEKDEIQRILLLCSQKVNEIAVEEMANLDTLAVLDALFAKAEWGKERDAIVAELNTGREVVLEKARHPLIDFKKVVPNNYHLNNPYHMLLITGPNTGGKTVSMKVIGLFVLMTYSGMPITAELAKIPFFDCVFVDVGDGQSVVSSLSSFSSHIKKISEILRCATKDSLVLLDEIGSGTDPREGESLAIAILNELRERGSTIVATTHYGRLKAYGKRHEDILLASVQFDMEKLLPTYRFIEGTTGQSNAFEVAQKYGLPKSIVKYASFLKEQSKRSEDILIERLEQQLQQTRQLQEQLQRQSQEIIKKEALFEEQRQKFESKKEQWLYNIKEVEQQQLDEAKQKVDTILKEIRTKQENAKYHEILKIRQKLVQNTAEPEEEIKKHFFSVGDIVEIRSSGQVARITQIRKKEIIILLHGKSVHVKEAQIQPSMKNIPIKKSKTSITIHQGGLFSSMPLEVNLIGKHVDEAMECLASYMDQARLHHLNHFRIIHGDGTGKLRKAVHTRLDKDFNVESYRIGMPQEGGTGATVVTMKG